jgi:hypothetical protein
MIILVTKVKSQQLVFGVFYCILLSVSNTICKMPDTDYVHASVGFVAQSTTIYEHNACTQIGSTNTGTNLCRQKRHQVRSYLDRMTLERLTSSMALLLPCKTHACVSKDMLRAWRKKCHPRLKNAPTGQCLVLGRWVMTSVLGKKSASCLSHSPSDSDHCFESKTFDSDHCGWSPCQI